MKFTTSEGNQMLNAVYRVNWVSPNGAVKGFEYVAATSETEARNVMLRDETRGRDGYRIGLADMLGDLPESHPAKYDTPARKIAYPWDEG